MSNGTYEIGNGSRTTAVVGDASIPVAVNEIGGRLLLAVRMRSQPRIRVGTRLRLTKTEGMARRGKELPEGCEFVVTAEVGASIRGMRQFLIIPAPVPARDTE